jgi:two-component system, OmpR family, response regulator
MNGSLERILVVDDDPYIQEIIAAALEDYGGYTVAGCTSGAGAIARAPSFRPDLILLDMVMPGMDGVTALEALRTVPIVANTPAIFLTAQAIDLSRWMQLPGVIGVLTKPFHHRTLVAQIGTLWEAQARAREPVANMARIAALRQRYLLTLAQHSDAIRALWAARSYHALEGIYQLIHQLAGSGASLGFAGISTVATRVETTVLHMLAAHKEHRPPNTVVDVTAGEALDALLALFYEAVRASATESPRWSDTQSTSAVDSG